MQIEKHLNERMPAYSKTIYERAGKVPRLSPDNHRDAKFRLLH